MSARMTLGLMPTFDKSALNIDFLAGTSIFLPPLRPFLPRGTGAESPNKSNADKCFVSTIDCYDATYTPPENVAINNALPSEAARVVAYL